MPILLKKYLTASGHAKYESSNIKFTVPFIFLKILLVTEKLSRLGIIFLCGSKMCEWQDNDNIKI